MSDQTETRSPHEIQAEIERTREQLGETVAALAEKTDVKARAREKVDETKQSTRAKLAPAIENRTTIAGVVALAVVALVALRRARG